MKYGFLIYIVLIFMVVVFVSGCGKEKSNIPVSDQKQQQQQVGIEDEDTTSLTPAESFAAGLCQDILNDDTEVDFESYLIDVVYPKVSNSTKVTLDRISSSIFLLTYYEGNTEKHLLIQKYFNPQKGEIYFESTETSLSPIKQFLK